MVPVMTDLSSKQQLQQWLSNNCALQLTELQEMPQVISRRQYYRAVTPKQSYVVTDAREVPESILSFATIGDLLHRVGWYTPQVFQVDADQGYMLQEDLGAAHWYDRMQQQLAVSEYQWVLDDLFKLQAFELNESVQLPLFDWSVYAARAVDGFRYYLQQKLSREISDAEQQMISDCVSQCVELLQQGPQVLCHRDFHSRNIMVKDQRLAHIDFQMLCVGPLGYDLASILRDAYVCLPDELVLQLLQDYFQRLMPVKHLALTDFSEFLLWFDAATVLRHLRCIGLFARMSEHDLYQQACHHAVDYLQTAASRQSVFSELAILLEMGL